MNKKELLKKLTYCLENCEEDKEEMTIEAQKALLEYINDEDVTHIFRRIYEWDD